MTGAIELFIENGSNEASAAAKPPIFPLGILLTDNGARLGAVGFTFWLTRADQDLGGDRVAGGIGVACCWEAGGCDGGEDVRACCCAFGCCLGRAGMITAFREVVFGMCLVLFGMSLQTPVEAFDEEGGRELCVSPPRLAVACRRRYRLRLFGNSRVGSDFHGSCHQLLNHRMLLPGRGDEVLWSFQLFEGRAVCHRWCPRAPLNVLLQGWRRRFAGRAGRS